MRRRLFLGTLLTAALLASCSNTRPEVEITLGEILSRESFEPLPFGWDTATQGNIHIGAAEGAYRIVTDANDFVSGFNSTPYADVVIDVQGIQLTAGDDGAYGVVCRAAADNRGNGYYFLVGADGSYTIRKGQFGEINALVHWARHDAIAQEAALNQLRAVCIQDYLALYINGVFVADVRDDTFSSGYIGFAAAAGAGSSLEVAFDDLILRSGILPAAD